MIEQVYPYLKLGDKVGVTKVKCQEVANLCRPYNTIWIVLRLNSFLYQMFLILMQLLLLDRLYINKLILKYL